MLSEFFLKLPPLAQYGCLVLLPSVAVWLLLGFKPWQRLDLTGKVTLGAVLTFSGLLALLYPLRLLF
ncbi:hypothetical protein ACFP81_12255 [Deinococcus lacus]|uniref:Uncharacterized protein n=1 Tax=Deinococcus lacus TaxID=392561 RepID=A0ABW1YE94_9DEIO